MENDLYRIMALDYGDVRIGIALSDLQRIIATGKENYTRVSLDKDIKHILSIANENNVREIVVGLPINMDGTKGERVEKTYKFVDELKKFTDLKISFLDERLTSVQAEKLLINSNVRREKRKQVIDKLSATIILQDYLSSI